MAGPDRGRGAAAPDDLAERGRASYQRHAWQDAYASLAQADQAFGLPAEDLWALAISAYMLGRDSDSHRALERGHRAYTEAGETLPAARHAFWLGFMLAARGEVGPATGWLSRARQLIQTHGHDCVEQGWLLLPLVAQHRASGDYDLAHDTAASAVAAGERFGDAELRTWALHEQGRTLIRSGRVRPGLELLDEAMVAVAAGECSPLATGVIYCSVIEGCREVYELRRARDWTAALTRWCEQQPGMVTFAGRCLVHRSEIMQLHGSWHDALGEARRAGERFSQGTEQPAAAAAFYEQAEVHRLQGALTAAENAYRSASRLGHEPQPGLALLRLAQGRADVAAAAMRRVVGETTGRLQRARLLPAHVEILLAAGDTDGARDACRELEGIAVDFGTDVLVAMAAQAHGTVEAADGDARTALGRLRHACRVWQAIGAPYETARAREQIGLVCRALGDDDGAALELAAARAAFEELGAAPDLARIGAPARAATPRPGHELTGRELQVLRLVAAGTTNKAIATQLVLSEKTVDRHVSNILTKLGVASRTAATAYAYQHGLL